MGTLGEKGLTLFHQINHKNVLFGHLTLFKVPVPQNCPTHSNNSSTVADK